MKIYVRLYESESEMEKGGRAKKSTDFLAVPSSQARIRAKHPKIQL
jgi:hypothetical protein